MTLAVVNSGELLALDLLVGRATAATLYVGLFAGTVTPGANTTIGSLLAVTSGSFGYAPTSVVATSWHIAPGAPSTATMSGGVQWTFTASAGAIQGYFIAQAGTNKLLAAETFSSAFTVLRSGDNITVFPQIAAGSQIND